MIIPYCHTGTPLSSHLVDQQDPGDHCERCNPADFIALSGIKNPRDHCNLGLRDRGGDRSAVISDRKLTRNGCPLQSHFCIGQVFRHETLDSNTANRFTIYNQKLLN